MIILGCDISPSIQFSRSGTRASGTATSQLSYLKDSNTRVRYVCTLPALTVMSVFTTSATRRSRSVRPALFYERRECLLRIGRAHPHGELLILQFCCLL